MNRLFLYCLTLLACWAIHPAAHCVVVDNDDGPPAYVESLPWTTSSSTGYNGGTYRVRRDAEPLSTATWTTTPPVTGIYEVSAIFVRGANRTAAAPYTIHSDMGTSVVTIDMTGSTALAEVSLGWFPWTAGYPAAVQLKNNGAPGYHIADAVRFARLGAEPPDISGLSCVPVNPVMGQNVHVTALVRDDIDPTCSVSVTYSVHGATSTGTVVALDDGLHGDGAAGDYTYGALMPVLQAGSVVLFSVNASDSEGNGSRSYTSYYRVTQLPGTVSGTFVMAGQSNACGPAELSASNETSDSRVMVFNNDYNWKVAYEPVNDATNAIDLNALCPWTPSTARGHSFALRAGKDLLESTRSVRLIPCAKGGTAISQWRKPADPFDRSTLFGALNYRVHFCSPEGITGLWWYQGEADAGSASFAQNHTALMAEFRSELGGNLPVIYAQLARNSDPTRDAAQFATAEVQRRLETGSGYPESIPSHHLVVTFDLPLFDSIHLNQAGVKELGRRVALATREHVYGESVDGTGPRPVLDHPVTYAGGNRSRFRVAFTRPVSLPANRYDNQFRVFEGSAETSVTDVQRDPTDPSVVLVSLSRPASTTAYVSYGEVRSPATGMWLPDALKGPNDLPAPRFGRLVIEMPVASTPEWTRY